MKILMIAPEPFFETRGTPFSEYFRIKALCHLKHTVDLVTYPIGEDKSINGLRIFRGIRPPFIKSVKTGPSFKKVILDIFLFFKVVGRLFKEKYDLIHTHEEANIMGVFFNKMTGIPHLYDMHSSLVKKMDNFQFTKSRSIIACFKFIEKRSLKNARSVIAICQSLFDYASTLTDRKKITVIENFLDETSENMDMDRLTQAKREIECDKKKIIMYTGTLEPYQGIPLLIDCLTYLNGDFCLVIIGGEFQQVEALKKMVRDRGLSDKVMVKGKKAAEEIPYYLKAADVLVSPRTLGTNIPLKIYSYLKSGVPVVATNLYTHTQSLNNEIAILTDPEPEAFANGIVRAVSDEGKKISLNAEVFCQKNYNPQRYLELVDAAVNKALD